MHSSSAACVFGEARLISSTSRRFANTGPRRNSNSFERWLKTLTPVTSDGSRSGVNCRRENEQSTERASAFASVVLPTPGRSSMIRWPSASRQRTVSSSISCGACTTDARLSTRRFVALAAFARTAALTGSSIVHQPHDLVDDLTRDPLLGRLLDPALAAPADEDDLVRRGVEADVCAGDVVEDDEVGALCLELLTRA